MRAREPRGDRVALAGRIGLPVQRRRERHRELEVRLGDAIDVAVGALDAVVVAAAGAEDPATAGIRVVGGAVPHARAVPCECGCSRDAEDREDERLHQLLPVLQVVPSFAPPSQSWIVW